MPHKPFDLPQEEIIRYCISSSLGISYESCTDDIRIYKYGQNAVTQIQINIGDTFRVTLSILEMFKGDWTVEQVINHVKNNLSQ